MHLRLNVFAKIVKQKKNKNKKRNIDFVKTTEGFNEVFKLAPFYWYQYETSKLNRDGLVVVLVPIEIIFSSMETTEQSFGDWSAYENNYFPKTI